MSYITVLCVQGILIFDFYAIPIIIIILVLIFTFTCTHSITQARRGEPEDKANTINFVLACFGIRISVSSLKTVKNLECRGACDSMHS